MTTTSPVRVLLWQLGLRDKTLDKITTTVTPYYEEDQARFRRFLADYREQAIDARNRSAFLHKLMTPKSIKETWEMLGIPEEGGGGAVGDGEELWTHVQWIYRNKKNPMEMRLEAEERFSSINKVIGRLGGWGELVGMDSFKAGEMRKRFLKACKEQR